MGEATLRTIQRIDAVCDCIPVISTLTNGAQLLYKLVRKVDRAANPVAQGWKSDLKIHMISKPAWECGLCMIPFAGNLASLIARIGQGMNDHLMGAVCRSNTEVVKLALANGHLVDSSRAASVLSQAVVSSNFEIFDLIFSSRDWSQSEVIEALPVWCFNDMQDKIANRILDYYGSKGFEKKGLSSYEIYIIIARVEDFVRAGRSKTADRILAILPQCPFAKLSKLLQGNASVYRKSYESELPKILTRDQIDRILELCETPTVQEFQDYCKEIHSKANLLKHAIECENQVIHWDFVLEVNVEHIITNVYFAQRKIIAKLMDLCEFGISGLTQTFSHLSNLGQVAFLNKFLEKYEYRLFLDDKLQILNETLVPSVFYPNSAAGFDFLCRRWSLNFDDEQREQLFTHREEMMSGKR
ncbi:MAG: hypothetical protein KR126chlam2_00171 [Chlamydiae bacterium]|nr:hypothetical protein [Chlamydiota bacterium]